MEFPEENLGSRVNDSPEPPYLSQGRRGAAGGHPPTLKGYNFFETAGKGNGRLTVALVGWFTRTNTDGRGRAANIAIP